MNITRQALTSGGRPKFWVTVSVIGLVAVSAGMILPQMLPSVSAVPKASADSEKPKSNSEKSTKDDLAYSPPAWPETPDAKAMIVRLVVGTAIVLGLCAGTLYLSKRWLGRIPAKTTTNGPLSLVDSLALGNRCHVYLVGVGQHRVLVGADAGGLKSVVPLPEPFAETLAQAQEDPPSPPEKGIPFRTGGMDPELS